MKLVAGLGNPDKKFEGTPHNVGFRVVDILLNHLGLGSYKEKFQSQIIQASLKGEACIFIKPQTYMNKSGHAVVECVNFYKIPVLLPF